MYFKNFIFHSIYSPFHYPSPVIRDTFVYCIRQKKRLIIKGYMVMGIRTVIAAMTGVAICHRPETDCMLPFDHTGNCVTLANIQTWLCNLCVLSGALL